MRLISKATNRKTSQKNTRGRERRSKNHESINTFPKKYPSRGVRQLSNEKRS